MLATWSRPAQASPCVFPDDGNDLIVHTECPRIDWTLEDGALSIPDHGELYWVDDLGRIHYERDLSGVPEPYRSMYRQGRRNAQGALVFEAPAYGAPAGVNLASETERLIEARATWRAATAAWQTELYTSLRELMYAMMRPAPLAINPLLFAYPPGRSIVTGDQMRLLADARVRALRARHMLLEVLPREAQARRVHGHAPLVY